MTETRPYKLGRKLAENVLEMGNLLYNERTKANFFRGVVRGLMRHKWIREIAKQTFKDLGL